MAGCLDAVCSFGLYEGPGQAAQVGAEADQASIGYQIGRTQQRSAQAQAEMTHAKSTTQGANAFVQAAGQMSSQISKTLSDLNAALDGIAAGGEEFARLNW